MLSYYYNFSYSKSIIIVSIIKYFRRFIYSLFCFFTFSVCPFTCSTHSHLYFIQKKVLFCLVIREKRLTLHLLSWKQSFYLKKELIPIEDLERSPEKVIAFLFSVHKEKVWHLVSDLIYSSNDVIQMFSYFSGTAYLLPVDSTSFFANDSGYPTRFTLAPSPVSVSLNLPFSSGLIAMSLYLTMR